MDLQQLRYFLVSTEKGSLTGAAEELYTSQPHVSQVIKSLEQELGKKLFLRTGSGIVLTPEGEQARLYAENALKNVSMIKELCGRKTRTLRIAANPSSRLARAAGDYCCRQGGGLQLDYTECGTERMLQLLQNGMADLGFLFVPKSKLPAFRNMTERRNLEFTPLLASDLVVYSGEKGLFYGRNSVRPEELDGCACIQTEDDFFQVEDILMRHEQFRKGRYALRKVIRTSSDHLMLHILQETALCNIGSYWEADTADMHGTGCAVVEGFRGQVVFGFLSLRSRQMRPEEEDFLLMLKSRMAKGGEDKPEEKDS